MERPRIAPARRDILAELKDRLREAIVERDEYLAKVGETEKLVEALTFLIDIEQQRLQPGAEAKSPEPSEALASFLFKELQVRSMTKDEMRFAAAKAGYDVDGRSIHAITVNMARTGRIKELSGGKFSVDPQGALMGVP